MNTLLKPKVLGTILALLVIQLVALLSFFAWRSYQKRLENQSATPEQVTSQQTTPEPTAIQPTTQQTTPEPTAPQPTATPQPTKPVVSASTLLVNGNFENGDFSSWEVAGEKAEVVSATMDGKKAIHFIGGNTTLRQKLILNQAMYTLMGQFKCNEISGGSWGHIRFRVVKPPEWEKAIVEKGSAILESMCGDNQWHKLALSFSPSDKGDYMVEIGTFGDRDKVDLLFDDLALVERSGENRPPILKPQSDVPAGAVPLKVSFMANGDDTDGSIDYYRWNFGDGGESRTETPAHTFYKRGTYSVTLTAWDNEGTSTISSLTVAVTDDTSPKLIISAPSAGETNEAVTTLQGEVTPATVGNSPIVSLAWDNLNTGEAGLISPSAQWTAESISLKPGLNEILVTALDQAGKIDTAVLRLKRIIAKPTISNLIVPKASVGRYEKYEVAFDVQTVADNPFFSYDEQPPAGIAPKIGVNVIGIFTAPSGTTLKQPGFFYTKIEKEGSLYRETNEQHWMVRFTPQEMGEYKVALQVTDATGTATAEAANLTVTENLTPTGFIKVSQTDPRYFEFSNGQLFFPIGPAIDSNYSLNKNALSMSRPWMAGHGAYSTNWARWVASFEQHGNEGFMSPLTFEQHYPTHELSNQLFCRASCGNDETDMDGWRIWFGWGDEAYSARFKAQARYQVKIRLKTLNITPDQSGDYGLTIKLHEWKPENQSWRAYLSQLPPTYSLIPFVNTDRDWHTLVTTFTAPIAANYISMFLQNAKTGQVYIDEFSIKEIDAVGHIVGGELVRNSKADMHTYVEQRPSAYFDWQLFQGEQNNVFFKYVIQDKNDWIPNHLTAQGFFNDIGGGYYQPNGTKARWLQQQWWRYLIARWGYSPAIHSWELNNEGSPDEVGHYQATQDLAQFMHQNDAHPHLVSTSFWCCWRPKFWGDKANYGAVDYADLHEYTDNSDLGDKQAQLESDFVALHEFLGQKVKNDPIGKPVIRGESGISSKSNNFEILKNSPNPGIWYHNLLWAQLDPSAVFDFNYWWSEHFKQVDQHYFKENRNGESRAIISQPFYQFVSGLELNRGYTDLAATIDNNMVRVVGQKNVDAGKAHLWIQNKQHTWKNVLDNPSSIGKQSATVTVQMKANSTYNVTWWDTYTGTAGKTEKITADAKGMVSLAVKDLENDVAVKME